MKLRPAVLEELIPGSNKLYFIFGGVAAGMVIPPFEFYASARIIDENKIFLRDFSRAWYQNGLPGVGSDLYAIRDYILGKIAELEPEEVFFVGNSMGGFAAILFASLVGEGTAIAFAPQTFISPLKRLQHRDGRWPIRVVKMQLRTGFKTHIWDLKAWLKNREHGAEIEIFVSQDDPLDLFHATRLRNLNAVYIHESPIGGHKLVKQLRDEGKLPDILSGAYRRRRTRTAVRSQGQQYGARPAPDQRHWSTVGTSKFQEETRPPVSKPNGGS